MYSTSYEFINRNKNPVRNPKITANNNETNNAANCKPPCFTGLELRAGVRPLRPPQNMALRIPPRKAIIIPSMGYPDSFTLIAYLSYKKYKMGPMIPNKMDANGSMITQALELIKMPVLIIEAMILSKLIF